MICSARDVVALTAVYLRRVALDVCGVVFVPLVALSLNMGVFWALCGCFACSVVLSLVLFVADLPL